MLWHFTAEFAPMGDIGKFSDAQIAKGCHWGGDPSRLVSAWVATGWLDQCPRVRLRVHDWLEHAPEFVLKSLKRKGLISDVSRQLQTTADKMCLPLPLPKPIPEPEPLRLLAAVDAPLPIDEWAQTLYARHPKKIGKPLVEMSLLTIAKGAQDPMALLRQIDRVHSLWCASESWTEQRGKFCPQLAKWLADEGWTALPPEFTPAVYEPDTPSPLDEWAAEKAAALARGEEY